MKSFYSDPEIELIRFEPGDRIVTKSNPTDDDDDGEWSPTV